MISDGSEFFLCSSPVRFFHTLLKVLAVTFERIEHRDFDEACFLSQSEFDRIDWRCWLPPGWYPPVDGKFTEYGPEDREWMYPLGIGFIVYRKFDMRLYANYDMPIVRTPFPYILNTF
jgi:hypothetical protein